VNVFASTTVSSFAVGIMLLSPTLASAQRAATPFRLAAAPEMAIGAEDREEVYRLDYVSGVLRLADGTIIVANATTGELRYFDAKGRYLRSASRRGAGPGEFGDGSSMEPYLLGGRYVIASDVEHARINRYAIYDSAGRQQQLLFELPTRERIVHTYGNSTRYPFVPFSPEGAWAGHPAAEIHDHASRH